MTCANGGTVDAWITPGEGVGCDPWGSSRGSSLAGGTHHTFAASSRSSNSSRSSVGGSATDEGDCEGVGLFASPATHASPRKLGVASAGNDASSAGLMLSLSELNQHFVCVLCFGYFVDATTITECMHTFCRSCIVSFLRTNRHCPHCDTLLLKTRPLSSLRSDRVMQALVYKTVPGLFQTEMRRRIRFYGRHSHAVGTPAYKRDVEEFQQFVFSPDDSVSLAIRHYDSRRRQSESGTDDEALTRPNSPGTTTTTTTGPNSPGATTGPPSSPGTPSSSAASSSGGPAHPPEDLVRYFRCPSTVPVSVLKQLVKSKYRVPDSLRVELLHGEDRLLDAWTLMEIAYIYTWTRESPLELSFQVVATRRVKKRRHSQHSVLNNDASEVAVDSSSSSSFPSQLPPPQPPASNSDDIKEPPEKVAKMEHNSDDCEEIGTHERGRHGDVGSRGVHSSHMTPLSPEDHHGRPPTPPETPESHQHIHIHSGGSMEAKSEDTSMEEQCDEDNDLDLDDSAVTLSEEADEEQDEEDEEEETTMGDQDSEAPLEVDTSHETEPELEIEVETDDASGKEIVDSNTNEESQSEHNHEQNEEEIEVDDSRYSPTDNESTENQMENRSDNEDSEDVKPTRRIRRNVVIQAGQDGSCAFSDTDGDEPLDESGALDLSDHARNVREARARAGYDISRGQGTQTMLSITQSKISKKKQRIGQQSASTSNPWQPTNLSHAATFHDLLTLSQAAVIQLALVQARAQEEAKKSMEAASVTKKLNETPDSLSFVNGSGDTLTISAINGNNKVTSSKSDTDIPSTKSQHKSHNTKNYHNTGSPSEDEVDSSDQRAVTNTLTISRAGKHGTLKSKLNKSPVHKSSLPNNALRIPSVSSPQHKSPDGRSKSLEKDMSTERTGDPIFKITNQKLSECFRQQMNNKLKQSNTIKMSSAKPSVSTGLVSPVSSKSMQLPSTTKSLPSSTTNRTQPSQSTSTKTTNLPTSNKIFTSQSQSKQILSPTFSKSFQSQIASYKTLQSNHSKSLATPKSPTETFSNSEKTVSQSPVNKLTHLTSTSSVSTTTNSVTKSPSSAVTKPMNGCTNNINRSSQQFSPNTSKSYHTPKSTSASPANGLSSLPSFVSTSISSVHTTSTEANNRSSRINIPQSFSKSSAPVTITPVPSNHGNSNNISKSSQLTVPRSNFTNGNGIVQTSKSISNGSSHLHKNNILSTTRVSSPCSSSSNSISINNYTMSSNNNKSISSSCASNSISNSISSSIINSCSSSHLLVSQNSISFTPLRTPCISSASRTLSTPIRTLLNSSSGISTSSITGATSLRTNTTNSAPVRATNSSVRQIPNPSLLHQQSESRLTGGGGAGSLMGARLGGVLSRLGGSSNGGISRLESLTRTLHEKAAGAAAAAINTAAR